MTDFEIGMDIRHEADYALTFEEESAKIVIGNARKFLEKTLVLLKK